MRVDLTGVKRNGAVVKVTDNKIIIDWLQENQRQGE